MNEVDESPDEDSLPPISEEAPHFSWGYHCGGGWSNNKNQNSVVTTLPGIDSGDRKCARHDTGIAKGGNRDQLDWEFVTTMALQGDSALEIARNTFMAAAVGANASARILLSGFDSTDDSVMIDSKGVIHTSSSENPNKVSKVGNMGYSKSARSSVASFNPPTIIGTGIRLAEPVVVNTKAGIVVTGSEMIPVTQANPFGTSAASPATTTPTWSIVTAFRLAPAHYGAGRLGRFAQLYEEFKFVQCSLAYITAVGTSTLGNTIVEYQANSQEPCRKFGSTSFLQNVMTSGNGTLMPIWKNFTLELPLNDTKFHPMSSDLTYPDQNDASAGDVIVYQKNAAALTDPGFYVMNYKIEFKGATLTPRLTSIPYTSGTGMNWYYQTLRGPYDTAGAIIVAPPALYQLKVIAGVGGIPLLPDTIYKVVMTAIPWGANQLNSTGPVVFSSSLVNYSRGGSQVLPNLSGLGGYTMYMSTNAQTGDSVPGSLFTTMAGAMAGSDGGDNAITRGAAKDAVCTATVGDNAQCSFNCWVCPINFNWTRHQAND